MKYFLKIFIGVAVTLSVGGCQNQPTKVMEETVEVYAARVVLVDTRSAFQFASYHIPGSVNLETSQFLLLKNARNKVRIFDPDLIQTIERLAKRGISPDKKVILIAETENSVEAKKWRWLLRGLEVEDVQITSFEAIKKQVKTHRYGEPASETPWTLKASPDLQNEFITKRAKNCFVNWNEKLCL